MTDLPLIVAAMIAIVMLAVAVLTALSWRQQLMEARIHALRMRALNSGLDRWRIDALGRVKGSNSSLSVEGQERCSGPERRN